ILGVAFKQVFARADLFYFPAIDEGLNRFSLEIVVFEKPAGTGLVAGFKPVVQQGASSVRDAFAPASLPRFDRLAQSRNASPRAQLGRDVKQARLIVIHGFLASRHNLLNPLSSSFDRFPRKQHLRSPLLSQVFPSRISRLNQSYLFRPSPTLQLFLTRNRLENIVKAFVIDQAVAVILTGESFDFITLVFQSSPIDVVRHPDVKRTGNATNDVGEVVVFGLHHHPLLCHPERSKCIAKRAFTESKDPMPARSRTSAARHSHRTGRRENALQRPCSLRHHRGPSTPCVSRFARDTFRSG